MAGREDNHLNKFLSFIKCTKPIYRGTTGNSKTAVRSSTCEIIISSRKIVEDLSKFGIGPRKSHTVEFPTIREDLVRHMIRGIWDGDGSVLYRKARVTSKREHPEVQLCGNINITNTVKNILVDKLGIRDVKLHPVSSIFLFRYNSSSAVKITNYLYKDSTIYLDRKYEKYLLGKDWQSSRLNTARKVG